MHPSKLFAGPPKLGDIPPEIEAKEWFNSPPLTLASLKGKIVVVEFWATWCPPCRRSIPHLVELHKKYSGKGVVIIGLSDEPPAMVRLAVENGLPVNPLYPEKKVKVIYPVGAGSRSAIAYNVRSIPYAFIINPEGKLAWDGHPMEMDEALEEILRQTPPILANPADIARAKQAIEEAERALKTQGYARAASLLAQARKVELPAELAKRADAVASAIDEAASVRLEEAKKLAGAGKTAEALQGLSAVARTFPGTKAAEEAKTLQGKLQTTPAGPVESDAERQAKVTMDMAKNLLQAGEKDKAGELLRSLIEQFPNSKAAQSAREELEKLK